MDLRKNSKDGAGFALKRKRFSVTNWSPSAGHAHTEDIYDRPSDLLPQVDSTVGVDNTGSRYRPREDDIRSRRHSVSNETDSYSLRYGVPKNGRDPEKSSESNGIMGPSNSYREPRDRGTRQAERNGDRSRSPDRKRPRKSAGRRFTGGAPTREDIEREARTREAEEYKKTMNIQHARDVGRRSSPHRGGKSTHDASGSPHPDPTRNVDRERQKFPTGSGSDAGTGPLNSTAKAAGPSTVQSNTAGLAADPRTKLVGVLKRFISEVTEQASLQLRRDSAKTALERKTAEYKKSQAVQIDFPSAAEAQKAGKDRAQKEFEQLERELNKKMDTSSMLIEEIADNVVPCSEQTATMAYLDMQKTIEYLTEKFKEHRSDWGIVKNRQQQLDQLYRTSLKNIETELHTLRSTTQDDLSSIKQEVSAWDTKTSTIAADVEEQKKGKDFIDLKAKVDGLSSRVNGFPSLRLELSKATESINSALSKQSQDIEWLKTAAGDESVNSTLAKHSQDIERLKTEVGDKSIDSILSQHGKDIERLKAATGDESGTGSLGSSVEILIENEGKFREALSEIQAHINDMDEEMKVADRKIDDVYSKFNGVDNKLKAFEYGPAAGNSNTDNQLISIDGFRKEIKELQDAGDELIESSLTLLQARIDKIDNSFMLLRDSCDQSLRSVWSRMQEMKESIKVIAATAAAQQSPDAGNIQQIRERLAVLETKTYNEVEGVRMGIANLDLRMNNMSTERLARRILSQLDEHVRNTETTLPTLDLRLQALERYAPSAEMLRREIDAIVASSLQRARDSSTEISGSRGATADNAPSFLKSPSGTPLPRTNEVLTGTSDHQRRMTPFKPADIESSD